MTAIVFDSSPLSCFARIESLPLLDQLTSTHERHAPKAVMDEVRRGMNVHPCLGDVLTLDWLKPARLDDSLHALILFAKLTRRLGSGDYHVGEASVLAWAGTKNAIAVLDDQVGRQCAREEGIAVKGTLSLVATGIIAGVLDERAAADLVDALAAKGGAWFPCTGPQFVSWARDQGLLA
jgi:predicted nucleic acid-binding protein